MTRPAFGAWIRSADWRLVAYVLMILLVGTAVFAAIFVTITLFPSFWNTVLHYHRDAFLIIPVAVIAALIANRLRCQSPSPSSDRQAIGTSALLDGLCLGGIAILLTLQLVASQTPGQPANPYTVARLLPFSDSGAYLFGSQRLLVTGELDDWNCRRPINAALLAMRLIASGHDLYHALILQSLLLGIGAFLFVRTLAAHHGLALACLVLSVLYLLTIVGSLLNTTASESLGLALGLIAATLLWHGAITRSLPFAAVGLFFLGLALSARAGPLFVLPLVVAWMMFTWPRGRFAMHTAAIAAAAILAAAAPDVVLRAAYGNGETVGHGNFYLTLYGIASGEPGWTTIYDHFPEAKAMSEGQINAFARSQAVLAFKANPFNAIQPLLLGGAAFVRYVWLDPLESQLRWLPVAFRMLLSLAIWALMARWLWIHRSRPEAWLMVAVFLGVLTSAPLIFIDGGHRVFIAMLPLMLILPGMSLIRPRPSAAGSPAGRALPGAAAVFGFALVCLALVGPGLHNAWSSKSERFRHAVAAVSPDDHAVIVWMEPRGPMVHLDGPYADDAVAFLTRVYVDSSTLESASPPAAGDDMILAKFHNSRAQAIAFHAPAAMIQGSARPIRVYGHLAAHPAMPVFIVTDHTDLMGQKNAIHE